MIPSILRFALILHIRLKTQKIFYLSILWFCSQKFRMCAHRRAKLPLYISQVVLTPTESDEEESCHLFSAYYGLSTVLSEEHTSIMHLFN